MNLQGPPTADSAAEPSPFDSARPGVCRAGGVAALGMLAYSLATMVQMIVLGGQPGSAQEAFDLLQHHRLIALLRLDLPTLVAMPLYYLIFLGLWAALRRAAPAMATIAALLAFAGNTLVLSTPTALSLIPLSQRYAAATSEAARQQLLTAGETLMAADMWHSAAAILGGVLLQCGAVLISVAMLKGGVFSRLTGWLGIAMHALDLAHIVAGPMLPMAGVVLMAVAGPLYPIWLWLVGRRLLKLARNQPLQAVHRAW